MVSTFAKTSGIPFFPVLSVNATKQMYTILLNERLSVNFNNLLSSWDEMIKETKLF